MSLARERTIEEYELILAEKDKEIERLKKERDYWNEHDTIKSKQIKDLKKKVQHKHNLYSEYYHKLKDTNKLWQKRFDYVKKKFCLCQGYVKCESCLLFKEAENKEFA